jgi:hypothetical protein
MIASMTISGNKIVINDLNEELSDATCESEYYNCFNTRLIRKQIESDIVKTENRIRELKRVVAWPF